MDKRLVDSDPAIMMGKPVVRGTRITVELILEKLAAGENVEQILSAHPQLNEDAIRAAVAAAQDPSNQTRFTLDDQQWKAFINALDRPPKEKPRLRSLFTESHITKRRK